MGDSSAPCHNIDLVLEFPVHVEKDMGCGKVLKK